MRFASRWPTGLCVACLYGPGFNLEVGPRQVTELRCDAFPVIDTFHSGSEGACFLLRAPQDIPLVKPNSTPDVW